MLEISQRANEMDWWGNFREVLHISFNFEFYFSSDTSKRTLLLEGSTKISISERKFVIRVLFGTTSFTSNFQLDHQSTFFVNVSQEAKRQDMIHEKSSRRNAKSGASRMDMRKIGKKLTMIKPYFRLITNKRYTAVFSIEWVTNDWSKNRQVVFDWDVGRNQASIFQYDFSNCSFL